MSTDHDRLNLKSVIKVRDSGLAEVLRIRLEEEGIGCVIEGGHQAGLSGVLPMRLLVKSSDFERAKKLIERCTDVDEIAQ